MKNTFKEIPNEYKVTSLVNQNSYLVDGELKEWKGASAAVYSTISSTKVYKPTLLGTVPDLTGEEALDALNAASKADARGQGLWPTMKVEARIAAMVKFVVQMKTKRSDIVKLLIWEIGKTMH